jgi:methyl-accepting chemotaxis protein
MITTWMILTFVFAVTTIAGIYSSINLLKKQELTEDWLVALENRLSNIITKTKEIDEKGMFEADDEVGTIFEQINNMIKTLSDFLAK